MNTFRLSLLFLILIQTFGCKGQAFQYKRVPSAYIPSVNQNYNSEVKALQETAVDLKRYLPANYVTDGSVDYTKQLQNGVDLNPIVLMPNFPILTSGIHLINGSTVIFQKNSLLIMAPSKQVWYEILAVNKVHNVTIYFANIKGDRDKHVGNKGEWGFGIGIESANNIKIISPIVSNCWGDGIYINNKTTAENKTSSDSGNILIDGARLDNNRRNGISIIEGNNITIKNSVISNTNGTSPMVGIDIEPNNGLGDLQNITLDSVTTFNNASFGVFVSLTAFISDTLKDISLTIKNCTDDGSNYGMGFAFGRSREADLIYAKGAINVINSTWKDGRSGELWLPFYASKNTVRLNFHNTKVFKNGNLITSSFKPTNFTDSKNIILNQ